MDWAVDVFFKCVFKINLYNLSFKGIYFIPLRAQSFTSLKADLCQDINGGLAFYRWINGTFP